MSLSHFRRAAAELARTRVAYAVDRSMGSIRVLTDLELVRGELHGLFGADYLYMTADDARAKSAQIMSAIAGRN